MMLFPDTFRASSLKLLDEATDSPVVSSVNDAVPEIANGLAGPDLSTIGMVYVSCEQAERVRSRGTNMAWHRIRVFARNSAAPRAGPYLRASAAKANNLASRSV